MSGLLGSIGSLWPTPVRRRNLSKRWMDELKIRHQKANPYHPKSNGVAERTVPRWRRLGPPCSMRARRPVLGRAQPDASACTSIEEFPKGDSMWHKHNTGAALPGRRILLGVSVHFIPKQREVLTLAKRAPWATTRRHRFAPADSSSRVAQAPQALYAPFDFGCAAKGLPPFPGSRHSP